MDSSEFPSFSTLKVPTSIFRMKLFWGRFCAADAIARYLVIDREEKKKKKNTNKNTLKGGNNLKDQGPKYILYNFLITSKSVHPVLDKQTQVV